MITPGPTKTLCFTPESTPKTQQIRVLQNKIHELERTNPMQMSEISHLRSLVEEQQEVIESQGCKHSQEIRSQNQFQNQSIAEVHTPPQETTPDASAATPDTVDTKISAEEEEEVDEVSSKTQEELFLESEQLARQMMEEESSANMRRLEAAQMQYALQMDEDEIAQLEEVDPSMAMALRLQREEQMGHQEEGGEFDEDMPMEVDVDDMTYEEMLQLGDRIGDVKEERWRERSDQYITSLPLVIYGSPPQDRARSSTEEKCLVCQCNYEEGDTLKKLPCNHHYHADCIDQWLQCKNTCPVCKKSISSPESQKN